MRTKLIKIVLAASILLAYAFTTSCSMFDGDDNSSSSGTVSSPSSSSNPSSSSRPSPNPSSSSGPGGSSSSGGSNQGYVAFNLNSQIYEMYTEYDEDLDDYVYVASPSTENGSIKEESLGKIGTITNGKTVNLQLLSKTIPNDELYSIFDEDVVEYCSVSGTYTHDGLGYWAYFRLYDTDDDPSGELTIQSKSGGFESIRYLYSPRAGKIVCNIPYEYSTFEYNLDIKKGWNEIYIKDIDSEDYYERKYSTSSTIMDTQVVWRFSPSYYPW